MKRTLHSLLLLLPVSAMAMPHVEETLELSKGWNAIYIESTPTNSLCEDFFRDTPVLGAAVYLSDANAATAQYDASGKEIVQAPVAFLQWIRGESASTLQSVSGGSTVLLYATDATNITFVGVPSAPRATWHKISSAETNEFLNLVGVSSDSKKVSIEKYFGEGPFGASSPSRAIFSVSGEDENEGPDLKDAEKAGFGRKATLVGGKAYALTATTAGDWPGVIGVQGDGVLFGADANYASVKVRNCGTQVHTFRFTMTESATHERLPPISRRLPRADALSEPGYTNVEENVTWEVSLEPDEVTEQIFSLDRSNLRPDREYGAILVIEDLGGSQMRVRLPVAAAVGSSAAVAYPTGLWVGQIALTQVSG
ncbi:MAG: hypothetical protein IJR99_08775, partial [Kiritimatiellae bacterium]|nr:hypothetical protein [Kiritimatiellia bacterium]